MCAEWLQGRALAILGYHVAHLKCNLFYLPEVWIHWLWLSTARQYYQKELCIPLWSRLLWITNSVLCRNRYIKIFLINVFVSSVSCLFQLSIQPISQWNDRLIILLKSLSPGIDVYGALISSKHTFVCRGFHQQLPLLAWRCATTQYKTWWGTAWWRKQTARGTRGVAVKTTTSHKPTEPKGSPVKTTGHLQQSQISLLVRAVWQHEEDLTKY